MNGTKTAVVGVGATGSVLAAALLKSDPETILVDWLPGLGEVLFEDGLNITGAISYDSVPVKFYHDRVSDLGEYNPNLIFVCTKTFHLPQVLEDLKGIVQQGTRIVCTQNGLGVEDLVAEKFGAGSVFRMALNFGVAFKSLGVVEAAFFNKPNHLGGLVPENRDIGLQIAALLTKGGLDTELVDDIKLFVWKKMVIKCTMASICAATDRTIKGAIEFPPTREIADGCFNEILAVAKAKGYDLGEGYLIDALNYLEKVGSHKDSMCYDIINKTVTEIDFLGGKVVEYGRDTGVPTPFFITMTNIIKTLEDNYLRPS